MDPTAGTWLGTRLASYRVDELIGRGGMGEVYRAFDLRLERPVALKLLTAALSDDERFRERMLRESRLAAGLDHPNVIPVYEAGEEGGHLFIAMRYVDGADLKALLRREGHLDPARVVKLATPVADALDAAHARGLVHRDVKPSNVLIDDPGGREHPYLADFGLTLSAGHRGPADGGLMGTIDYVAPEQVRGDDSRRPRGPVRADLPDLRVPHGHIALPAQVGAGDDLRAPRRAAAARELAPRRPAERGRRRAREGHGEGALRALRDLCGARGGGAAPRSDSSTLSAGGDARWVSPWASPSCSPAHSSRRCSPARTARRRIRPVRPCASTGARGRSPPATI